MKTASPSLRLWLAWFLTAGLVWAEAPKAPIPSVELRDDRGDAVTSSLEICFRTDLRSDCVTLPAGERFTPPGPLRSLRVEGPDHGPASFDGPALRAGEDGLLRLRVPRKALLQIDKPPAGPLDAAVYDPKAAAFDKPVAGFKGVGPAGVRIPAGDFLVALSAGRKAPDLHRLAVRPGDTARLAYQPREGWSLVVRSRDAGNHQAVAAAVISLASVPGYGVPSRPAGEDETGADGLALFPGLAGRRIDAGVRHPEFLPQTAEGLSAAPGGLAFRDVDLEEGGRVRARVQVKGQPREGALCKVVDLREPVVTEAKDWKLPVLYEGRTDRLGICRSDRLPAGSYLLVVRLGEGQSPLERSVTVKNGQDAEEDLAFTEIRVRGTVTRKDDPAPGLLVSVLERNEALDQYMGMMRATTGKDGTYEVVLPKPGRYRFVVGSSPDAPQASYRDVPVDTETTVDFSLEKASIRGKVVNEQEKPVADALVELRWNGSEQALARTDERGEFELLLEGPGKGDVKARKRGYRESAFHDVALEDETEPPPFVLVLAKEKAFRGTLATAAGQLVPGGWIAAVQNPLGDEGAYPSESRTDAAGRFELAPRSGRRNRLFASGPGCPLSSFDPVDTDGELSLRCQGRPAVLEFTLTYGAGEPAANLRLILRHDGVIIPTEVLARHLAFLGLRAETDAYGHLVIPNLAPGQYDVFIAGSVTEGMIEVGSRTGFLATTVLTPLSTVGYQLTVQGQPVPVPAGGGE